MEKGYSKKDSLSLQKLWTLKKRSAIIISALALNGSFKKKMVFPEDRVGATCILHVLYPELQAVAGWTKPGHLGDYFYIKYNYCDEKSKFKEKIEEEYIRDEYFLTKA